MTYQKALNPSISVVVPVKNEVTTISPLIDEICEALGTIETYEIVYIDDGSTDTTFTELKHKKLHCKQLSVYRHDKSYGQSAAICTGVINAKGPVIITLDGDGQNDPADIPNLLSKFRSSKIQKNFMVVGWRTARKDTLLKRITSKVANAIRKNFLGDDTPDAGCGIKIFARLTFLSFPKFDHMHRFLPALMVREGGCVSSIPVNHRQRLEGTSNYGFWDRALAGFWDIFGMIWLMNRSTLPTIMESIDSDTTYKDTEM